MHGVTIAVSAPSSTTFGKSYANIRPDRSTLSDDHRHPARKQHPHITDPRQQRSSYFLPPEGKTAGHQKPVGMTPPEGFATEKPKKVTPPIQKQEALSLAEIITKNFNPIAQNAQQLFQRLIVKRPSDEFLTTFVPGECPQKSKDSEGRPEAIDPRNPAADYGRAPKHFNGGLDGGTAPMGDYRVGETLVQPPRRGTHATPTVASDTIYDRGAAATLSDSITGRSIRKEAERVVASTASDAVYDRGAAAQNVANYSSRHHHREVTAPTTAASWWSDVPSYFNIGGILGPDRHDATRPIGKGVCEESSSAPAFPSELPSVGRGPASLQDWLSGTRSKREPVFGAQMPAIHSGNPNAWEAQTGSEEGHKYRSGADVWESVNSIPINLSVPNNSNAPVEGATVTDKRERRMDESILAASAPIFRTLPGQRENALQDESGHRDRRGIAGVAPTPIMKSVPHGHSGGDSGDTPLVLLSTKGITLSRPMMKTGGGIGTFSKDDPGAKDRPSANNTNFVSAMETRSDTNEQRQPVLFTNEIKGSPLRRDGQRSPTGDRDDDDDDIIRKKRDARFSALGAGRNIAANKWATKERQQPSSV